MKKYTLFMIALLSYLVANAQNYAGGSFRLIVKTKGMDKHTRLFLAWQIDGRKIIDSADLDQQTGNYTFTGKIDRPLPATLVADPDRVGLNALVQKTKAGAKVDLLKLYLHKGIINLHTPGLLANGKFSGSAINVDNKKLQQLLKPISDQQLAVSVQLRATRDTLLSRRLAAQLDSLNRLRKPVLKKFIIDNPGSYMALVSLSEYGGSFPDVAIIYPMFKKLAPEVSNSTPGREYYKFLMDRENLVSGTKAPEFTQNDTAGKPVSLSAFRGKYVLLDFWASWCGPCRAENPHMRQLYQDFGNRNFTILGISLDAADGKAGWIKAINDDHLNWTQVSDLKHWSNSVAKLYSIYAIPQSFLIDPNGIIIAKGLNYQELTNKLNQVLPQK
jgi:peroxiredoxin